MEDQLQNIVPLKVYFSLQEACDLKGANRKTCYNNKYLQPNFGVPDARVGIRKRWNRDTILKWLCKSNDDLLSEYIEFCNARP